MSNRFPAVQLHEYFWMAVDEGESDAKIVPFEEGYLICRAPANIVTSLVLVVDHNTRRGKPMGDALPAIMRAIAQNSAGQNMDPRNFIWIQYAGNRFDRVQADWPLPDLLGRMRDPEITLYPCGKRNLQSVFDLSRALQIDLIPFIQFARMNGIGMEN